MRSPSAITLACLPLMAAACGSAPTDSPALSASSSIDLGSTTQAVDVALRAVTTTPIRHLVVIFQENVSFDHYFGTYPVATNPAGEPEFVARRGTPTVNGLNAAGLLTNNQNQINPFRFDRAHAATCDQDHTYRDEQRAFAGGNSDLL